MQHTSVIVSTHTCSSSLVASGELLAQEERDIRPLRTATKKLRTVMEGQTDGRTTPTDSHAYTPSGLCTQHEAVHVPCFSFNMSGFHRHWSTSPSSPSEVRKTAGAVCECV